MRVPADWRRFKLRGATNRLLQLSPEERERGVVAFSSGNHARGVAIAARRLGIRAIIVMPADAPQVKIDGTRAEGRRDRLLRPPHRKPRRDRRAHRRRDRRNRGAELRRSCDRRWAGNCGLEIVEQLAGRRRGSSFRAAAADLPRASRLRFQRRRSSSSSPKGGTTWRARSSWARSCRSSPMRPTPSAMRSDAARLADHLRHPAASASASALSVSDAEVAEAMRFAWEQARAGGRAGRSGWRLPRCLRARLEPLRGYRRRAVGRKYRSGASRADHRERSLSDVAGLVLAGFDMGRARSLDRLGQLLELGGEGLQLGGQETALVLGNRLGSVDQRVEHHRDARQDRFLDPLERLVEARLLVALGIAPCCARSVVKSW